MIQTYIQTGTLTDKSKVYDLNVFDFEQESGMGHLRINCSSKEHAQDLEQALKLIFKNFEVLA